MYEEQLLFDNGSTRATLISCGASIVVVTFPSWTLRQSDESARFGEQFLTRLGVDVLQFSCSRNEWFQDVEDRSLYDLGRLLHQRYTSRVGYGSSMGGYATMRFAQVLGIDRIFAVSPQVTLLANEAPWEYRFRLDPGSRPWNHPEINAASLADTRLFVLFDPHDRDALHLEILRQRCVPFVAIPVPYAGHPAGGALAALQLLQPLATSIIFDVFQQTFWERLQQSYKVQRKHSPQVQWNLGKAAHARGHRQAGMLLMQSSLRLSPNPDRFRSLSRLLLEEERSEDAVSAARSASALAPDDVHATLNLSFVLGAASQLGEAIAVVENALRIAPQSEALHRHLSLHLERVGRADDALLVVERAIASGLVSDQLSNRARSLRASAVAARSGCNAALPAKLYATA